MEDELDLGPDISSAESAPDEVLDSPEVKAELERAQERIRKGETRRGKTAEDLLNLARDRR